jgi:transposase
MGVKEKYEQLTHFLYSVYAFFYLLALYSIEMAKNRRRSKRKKKQRIKISKLESITKPETITGKYRVMKSVNGTYLVVQASKDKKYRLPEANELSYLVKKKLITRETGKSVPLE